MDIAKAKHLIRSAKDITLFVRDQMPEELQWPEYQYNLNIKLSQAIMEPANDA